MDRRKKELLTFILSLQFALLGSIGLDQIGLEIPILRQAVGFFYLTFIPGILLLGILGILRNNNLSRAEIILYSVGLSLSFLIFVGFIINFFLPYFGISKPISEIPLVFTITFIIMFLWIIFYFRCEGFEKIIPDGKELYPIVLLFALFPFIAVFGAYFLNYHNSNTVLLTLYAVISLTPLLALLKKFPSEIYPFVVWIISISLVFSVSLSVKHLSHYQSDALVEYYYANLVYTNGVWDPSVPGNHNAMLRIVILHPIYSILLNLDLKNTFRIIHPLLYSFTPVALYIAFKRQTSEQIAFLSSFFFMSIFSFYVIFSRNTRMGIAEFFLALFILSLTNRNMSSIKRTLLLIIFGLSIVVSHYGTSYVFMFSLISVALFSILIRKYRGQYLYIEGTKNAFLKFTLTYVVFTFAWYMYNSSSSPLRTFVQFFSYMISRISDLSPETSYTVYALAREWTFSIEVSKNLLLITSFFIAVGITSLVWSIIKKKEVEFQWEFAIFSIVFFGVVLTTFFARGFNPARIYHLALCFLAPFSVIGFIRTCSWLKGILKNNDAYDSENYLKVFAIFLMVFFLFNTGFVSETLTKGNDYSPNILISKPRAHNIDDPQYIYSFYSNNPTDWDIFSAGWLSQVRENSMKIYIDRSGVAGIFYSLIGPPDIFQSSYICHIMDGEQVTNGYIFLSTYNVIRGISVVQTYPPVVEKVIEVYPIITSNKIYTNGGSEIYFKE